MAWLRHDDRYTTRREWDGVSYEARWHYQALTEECSRGGRWDGRLPLTRALRASDVPDPQACLAELEAIGYLTVTRNAVDNPAAGPVIHSPVTRNGDTTSGVTSDGVTVTVTRIDEHVPPPSVRDNAAKSAVRMRRYRAHKQGQHHLCLPKNCPSAPAENGSEPAGVTPRVTRNPGTGLDQSSTTGAPVTRADDRRQITSGLEGGAGGGPRAATRNASPPTGPRDHAEPSGGLGDAVQNRKGSRWLNLHWGLPDDVAAHVIGQIRADAAARGIPIRSLPDYLAAMHTNGDLTDLVGVALDRAEGRSTPWGATPDQTLDETTPTELRLIEDPRARRKAIDACDRCDHNGLTRDDKPRRCDHKPPNHGHQPFLIQAVDDPPPPLGDTHVEPQPAHEAEPTPPERCPDGSFGSSSSPPSGPLTLQEANQLLDALPEHMLEYYISRAALALRRDGRQLDGDELVIEAATFARRRSA